MSKILILSFANISRTQKIFFLLMGIMFIIQGVFNLDYKRFYILALVQLTLGFINVLYVFVLSSKIDYQTFIELKDDEIAFKKNYFSKVVNLKASKLVSIKISKFNILIKTQNQEYRISLGDLTYLKRINDLPVFLQALEDFKIKHKIN
ncbi:MAG: hypothetical protein ACOYU5_09230 [Stygiobacter sp.]